MKFARIGLAMALVTTLLLYWPSMHAPFLFDDLPNLAALNSIDHVASWQDIGIYLSQARGFPGRPLAMLSFLLQKAAWPDNPFPFRLINVLLHLLCGIFVFKLTLRLARHWLTPRLTSGHVEARASLAALLAAMLWLLNPIQLSGVVLIIQRMTILMALFLLLGIYAYVHAILSREKPSWQRMAWMLFGLGFCMVLSVLSKENGILLPLYALTLDATILRNDVEQLPRGLKILRRALIYPPILFVLGYLAWLIPVQWNLPFSIRNFTLAERLLTEPRILLSYLDKIFLPRFGLYGLYHDGYKISRNLTTPWSTLPATLALVATTVVALAYRRKKPLLSLAVLWYLGGQIIESTTVMLELYFEHRNYTPLIGIAIAIAIAIAGIQKKKTQRLVMITMSLWLVACGITTALSARVYASPDKLALTWANSQPNSLRAQNYLAGRLMEHGQFGTALKIVKHIGSKYPNDPWQTTSRIYIKCLMGTLHAQDIDHGIHRIRQGSFDTSAYNNMKQLRVLAFSGTCRELNPANWLKLADAMLANPNYSHFKPAVGFIHFQKHYWYAQQGDLNGAIHELNITNKLDPDAQIPRLEARYLASAGLYKDAIDVLTNANYKRLPRLRRLLVDDRQINAKIIQDLRASWKKNHEKNAVHEIKATPSTNSPS